MYTKKEADFYSAQFYKTQVGGSARSAAAVVPLVLSLLPIKSVVDVGCGVAPWAAEFFAKGVQDILGVDGEYVDRSQLRIPLNRFLAKDLTKPLLLGRTFDLAVCLEVGEHLPESRARGLVADLTSLAPCVLFSAAVPGQGGTNHINEQYLHYWVNLFEQQGFEGTDPLRPRIFGDSEVEWFYQQNVVMFAALGHPLLAKGFAKAHSFIHPLLYDRLRKTVPTVRNLARFVPYSVLRSIRNRMGLPVGTPLHRGQSG